MTRRRRRTRSRRTTSRMSRRAMRWKTKMRRTTIVRGRKTRTRSMMTRTRRVNEDESYKYKLQVLRTTCQRGKSGVDIFLLYSPRRFQVGLTTLGG